MNERADNGQAPDGQGSQDRLNVWHEERLLGVLWRDGQRRIGFRYDKSWTAPEGFAISRSLPLPQQAQASQEFSPQQDIAHRFFANLLPEGNVRERVVRDLKVPNTDFDLLRAIGGECAGALSILPPAEQPTQTQASAQDYEALDDSELARLIARRGQTATWKADTRPRLSLAGAQDKCPVMVADGRLYLPKLDAPTTHILKFEPPDYRNLPAYETFTTLLAHAVGLPVVDVQLRSHRGKSFAVVERYDRQRHDGDGADGAVPQISRLHQEDFCQALGFDQDSKYQEHGGPTFADCCRLVREACSAPDDLEALLRWQIFNTLAGNSDGHAKNLSLLYLPDGKTRLAPFYDLVCTRAFVRVDHKLAFAIGGGWDPALIQAKHWRAMAEACDVQPRLLLNLVQQTASALLQQLAPVREAFEAQHGPHPALQRIDQVVQKQCRRTLAFLS